MYVVNFKTINTMKTFYIIPISLLSINLFAQVGINTTNPDPSSALEIVSPDKGVLFPRVQLNNLTQKLNPDVDNAISLFVYNLGTTDVAKGFYVWNGTIWVRFTDEENSYWQKQGTSTTSTAPTGRKSNKVGKTNESIDEKGTRTDIFQFGKVGIGYKTGAEVTENFDVNITQKQLDVFGDFRSFVHSPAETVKDENGDDVTFKEAYYCLETNSKALPTIFGLRGNIMYAADNKDVKMYSYPEKPYVGNIFIQAANSNDHVIRDGVVSETTDGSYNQETKYSSTSFNIIGQKGKQRISAFSMDDFSVSDYYGDDNIQFGMRFDETTHPFYIGNFKANTNYKFPAVKGSVGQVLRLTADGGKLEWVNMPTEGTILEKGNDKQILSTRVITTGTAPNEVITKEFVWIDQPEPFVLGKGDNGQMLSTKVTTTGTAPNEVTVKEFVWVDPPQSLASSPQFFYMPSVVLPTSSTDTRLGVIESGDTTASYDFDGTKYTVDLHLLFSKQFTKPIATSTGTTTVLNGFVLASNAYDYAITFADQSVFENIAVNAEGKLTYTIKANSIIKTGSFMNIVLKVK